MAEGSRGSSLSPDTRARAGVHGTALWGASACSASGALGSLPTASRSAVLFPENISSPRRRSPPQLPWAREDRGRREPVEFHFATKERQSNEEPLEARANP